MASGPIPQRQRLWQELDLLCRLGLGLAPIAAEVCAVLRALVGADAAALFWLDEHGQPAGFHHEDSPASVRNLFLNEPQLFAGPGETSIVALARPGGPRTGRLLSPGAAHYRSNGHNLLMRPNGHHYALDLRVEVLGPHGSATRAVAALFRAEGGGVGGNFGSGFGADEAALLDRACPSLQRAFIAQPGPGCGSAHSAAGHVLIDAASLRPLSADAQALQLLQHAHLPGLGLYGASADALPPHLLALLGLQPGDSRQLAVPQGLLSLDMRPLQPAAAAPPSHWLLRLQLQRPQQIDVVRRVLALPLTPLQREIAVLAGLGHARADSLALAGISNAALKKHLGAILDTASASNWDELGRRLRG